IRYFFSHKIISYNLILYCTGHRLMPTMMEGLNMDNMMPGMMKEMMPDCLWHLLPKMPNKMRVDFISNMAGILVQQGSVEMSEKEKEDLVVKIIEKANRASEGKN
ncbi:hypothetical protein ACFLX1_02250, partial [Chloroflexota bacterium]